MTRSPLFLAALASSAVPGLDPVTVEGVPGEPGDLFEIAYVQDSQDRRWVVKAPCTAAAGAMLDDISTLSGLLGRRLDVAMPMVRGFAPVPEGRASVYLRVPGRPLDFAELPAGQLSAEVGRTLAHIHNVEHLLFEEAGRPTYDAEAHRRRQLSELDRAAATGHVPTGLLTRWEHALEDVSLWRFAPCAVHGTFTGQNVLASFENDDDSSSGHVRGVLAWEESRVGDPADDFAELASVASPDTLDAVLEAYADSRIERPDVHLVRRARLAAEMAPLRTLLHALAAGQLDVVERTAGVLRRLDARVGRDDRRRAAEDAERSERTRRARERAAAASRADEGEPSEQPQHAERTEPPQQSEHPEHAEHPEPEWDATQPHVPFPMLGETQAMTMPSLPIELEPSRDAPEAENAVAPAEQPAQSQPESHVAHSALHDVGPSGESQSGPPPHRESSVPVPDGHAPEEPPAPDVEPGSVTTGHVEDSQPVPVVAADSDASPFEIDEVEALPEDAAGVLDLHEGASEFVPVTSAERPHDAVPGQRGTAEDHG